MVNYYLDRDQLGGWSCATLITLSRCSGNATFLNPTLRTSQLTENHGGLRVQLDWKISAASEQVASDRRARRHAASQATPAGPACPQCGRICTSDFGLRSHLRSHRRPQNWHPSSTTSWSKSTDYYKQASQPHCGFHPLVFSGSDSLF